jgi:phosphoglycerol transferase MdoB-like AlkP superfamily enzyme
VDPYLARRGPAPSTIATRLARRGYRTLFIHPFRAGFFGRDVVVPRLGFETLIFEEGFAGAERFGPYVSDRAMARRILDEADRSAGAPTLVTAITMENHGPWTPERLPHEPDPTRQYLEHLRNADAAIEMLIDGLSRRPGRTLLCFFGDHPPILPGIVPSAAPETDYAVLVFGDGQPLSASPARRLTADALGRLLVKLCGAADAPPGAGALGREPEASLSRG